MPFALGNKGANEKNGTKVSYCELVYEYQKREKNHWCLHLQAFYMRKQLKYFSISIILKYYVGDNLIT